MGAGDARTIVSDGQRDAGPRRPAPAGRYAAGLHANDPALPPVLRRVVEQVLQHLLQLVVVAGNRRQVGGKVQFKPHVPLPHLRLEGSG